MKSAWVTGTVEIWSEIVVESWQFLSSVNIPVVGAHEKKKKLHIHNVHLPPFLQGGWATNQIFKLGVGRLTRTQLLEKVPGKEGVTFFQEGFQFSHKK